jgi:hypothetical protein
MCVPVRRRWDNTRDVSMTVEAEIEVIQPQAAIRAGRGKDMVL